MKILENQVCDICKEKSSIIITKNILDPYCGKLSIFSIKCKNCGYKKNDVGFLEPKEPKKYILKVNRKKDLNIKIVKSSYCELEIPTFGLSIESGLNSDGFVTNVEGVLQKFLQKLNLFEDNEKKLKIKKKLERAISGLENFEMILKDDSGNSMIVGDKVEILEI